MEAAALSAARHLIASIESKNKLDVAYKEDFSLVMNLDVESQQVILATLKDVLPIVAEEDPASHERINSASSYFLVDPIDGTTSCKRFLNMRGGHVGFGPLIGLVEDGRLVAATFYHLPHRTLYSAVDGKGAFAWESEAAGVSDPPPLETRRKLVADLSIPLREAGVLFFPGTAGELRIVEHLRVGNVIENMYRFGGFANDAVRLACGTEQVQVQFSVKPWDFSAVLFPVVAGMKVLLDPLKRRIDFREWKIEMNNPLVVSSPGTMADLLKEIDKAI